MRINPVAWGYKIGGADPVTALKTAGVNTVHGLTAQSQNDSSSAATLG